MFKFKRKGKRILSIVLLVGLLVGAVAVVSAIAGRNKADDGYDLVNVDFDRGGLDASGKYEKSKKSIYTENAFECGSELKVKIDFDSNVTYQVYFYNESDSFISSSDEYTKTEVVEIPEGATHARLLVTPIWEADVEKDDQIVRLWNVNKYAKQLKVMIVPVEDAE